MDNERKYSTKSGVNQGHSSDEPLKSNSRMASVTPNNVQSADASAIKQESDIKQEPVSVGELVDVSVSTHRNAVHVPSFDERDTEYDFDHLSWDEAKAEKEEKAKTSADNGKQAMVDQQDRQPPSQNREDLRMPESGNVAHNRHQRGGNAYGNTSKPHKCEFCEYSAQYKCLLNRHMLKHTGEKPHGCTLCPKRFKEKRNLLGHMKAHVQEFLFYCLGCLQGFDGKEEKTEHESNCKIRRYECHLCKKSFGSHKIRIVNHIRVHSGDKPFECEECFKQFSEKGSLSKHMKLHAGARPFRCSKCHEGFSDQDERDSHEEECNRRVYKCYVCRKSIGLKKFHLIGHMRTHSGETPFQCTECPRKFSQNYQLKRHMYTHKTNLPFECLICRRGFLKNDKRKEHQRNCNGRYYECYLCKKLFRSSKDQLKGHMHTHSGEKPFRCDLCRKTFTWKSNLNRHMKNSHRK
ncbi:zinc finger protein OZF-like [Sitodiplosis mosellana]|uniref:zinc finger protein OZF-like n=1 Tax=Sitodiplosis mosellana TaxID=263140 RepID=UPI002443A244|nr:zinc finger protein OZF-like [Sitodiplosis mosellana]